MIFKPSSLSARQCCTSNESQLKENTFKEVIMFLPKRHLSQLDNPKLQQRNPVTLTKNTIRFLAKADYEV